MINYNTITNTWEMSLELEAQKNPNKTAKILIQHMIDIGDIIEQSDVERAWWEALSCFENNLRDDDIII